MSKALIISNHAALTGQLYSKLSSAGWAIDSTDLKTMLGSDSMNVSKNQCVLLVIDADFLSEFGKYINEMALIVRNYAICAPLYLIFEGKYDPNFSSWLSYTKRLFQSLIQPQKLHQAIEEIIRLESREVPRTAYCSPMDAY